jgi:hypothetical protein
MTIEHSADTVVLDAFSQRVVGWALETYLRATGTARRGQSRAGPDSQWTVAPISPGSVRISPSLAGQQGVSCGKIINKLG